MPEVLSRFLRWVVAPATEPALRSQAVVACAVRVLAGLLWLTNVGWKTPPDFGQAANSGLFVYTSHAVENPVFAPYSFLVENLVLPAFVAFGWGVLVAETLLAVLLLTGTQVRIAALLGMAQSVAIGLSVAATPNEWPWSYWLMIAVHAMLLVSPAGRLLGADGVRAGVSPARTLGRVAGVLAVLVGVVAAVRGLGDPLAGRGPTLQVARLAVSLGEYNLLGGLLLVLIGVLVLVASAGHRRPVALLAAALGILAALLTYVQLAARGAPLLGGTPSSAAVFLSAAAVAALLGRAAGRTAEDAIVAPSPRHRQETT